jgi:hypothetical protein
VLYRQFVVRKLRFQVSAQPPAKKTAGQIEKETEVSYKRRRWPQKFTRLWRAASLIEKDTLALASFLLGIN